MNDPESPWRELKNLLLPVRCAGCGEWDTPMCEECAQLANAEPREGYLEDARGRPEIRIFSLGPYGGHLRNVILAAKHQPHRDLDWFLRAGGITLGKRTGQALVGVCPSLRSSWLRAPLWVVPAPPSHARRRRREEVVPQVAAGVALGLRQELTASVPVVRAVALRPGVKGQEGRSAGVRGRSRHGSMRLASAPPREAMVVVVDDVVTTGATLREVASLLGEQVVGAAALAVAER